MFTPKIRMLNAYRGIFSDRWPVAPEFWYYYPARVLGVSMVEFEREIPFWQALQTTFKKYGTEGWGAAFPVVSNPEIQRTTEFRKISETQYRESVVTKFRGKEFNSSKIYDLHEPSWVEQYLAKDGGDLQDCIEMALSEANCFDYHSITDAYNHVGEDYLLELWLGTPFFDFIAEMIGFEKAVIYFINTDEDKLTNYRERYTDYQKRFIREICRNTCFESFAMGCSFSCNSLIGPNMWRKWDKPYIEEIASEIHKHGKLLHIHFHGRAMETVEDFSEMGIDCVCPFERPLGGDIKGVEELKTVRRLLKNKVTMNGNVHTIDTLIRGTTEDVRREVQEIKEAFKDSARLIIGTGDQVGRETPEENIYAMVDEAVKV